MVTLAGIEPATCGLGNRRSIHLSYRATANILTRNISLRLGFALAPGSRSGSVAAYAGNLFISADARRNHGRSRRFR